MLSAALGKRADADPRLPAACIMRAHVLEHLIRGSHSEVRIEEVLTRFEDFSARRLAIRWSAENVQTADSAFEPTQELMGSEDFDAAHRRIQALIESQAFAEAAAFAREVVDAAQQQYACPHPLTLLLLGQSLAGAMDLREAEAAFRLASRLLVGVI
jgi:hypothetical protein